MRSLDSVFPFFSGRLASASSSKVRETKDEEWGVASYTIWAAQLPLHQIPSHKRCYTSHLMGSVSPSPYSVIEPFSPDPWIPGSAYAQYSISIATTWKVHHLFEPQMSKKEKHQTNNLYLVPGPGDRDEEMLPAHRAGLPSSSKTLRTSFLEVLQQYKIWK